MQQNHEKQTGSSVVEHKDWKVDPPLWEVICSTVLSNPAEQTIVKQVIGETLIQESTFLHREALALRDILSSVKGNQCPHEPQGHATKPSSQSLIKDGHVGNQSSVRTNPPRHPCPYTKDDCRLAPHRIELKKTNKEQLKSRTSFVGLNKPLRPINGDAYLVLGRSKAKKDNDATSMFNKPRRSWAHGDGTCKVFKQKVPSSPPHRSILSCSSSPSCDTLQDALQKTSLVSNHNVEKCSSDILALDYSAFLNEKGAKMNAYDIDEVVDELRDALATERVYFNWLVEQLRRALEECIDCYPLAHDKPKGINVRVKVSNKEDISKYDSSSVHRTSKNVMQVSQRPLSPLSKPSLAPIVKNTKLEKSTSKPSLSQLPKTTFTLTGRPLLKRVVPMLKY